MQFKFKFNQLKIVGEADSVLGLSLLRIVLIEVFCRKKEEKI